MLSLSGPVPMEKVHYCERFIELMIDLEVSNTIYKGRYVLVV